MDKDNLQDEVKKVVDEVSLEKERPAPYWVFENDYWHQPRDVCVVGEINCLEDEDVEILCGLNPKNEEWIRSLARTCGFTVERKREFENSLGKFAKFIVRKIKS